MKAREIIAWLGLATAIFTCWKSCNEVTNCKTDNDSLVVKINNLNFQNQEMSNQNVLQRTQIDSLNKEKRNLTDERDQNARTISVLIDKKYSLTERLDSLTSADSLEKKILTDSLVNLNDSIKILQEENLALKSKYESINQILSGIDTTYKTKYWSIVSRIDSFFNPFQVENIKIIPKYIKKDNYMQSSSMNGIYERSDFTKIDCIIKTKSSNIFSLDLPDSLAAKKKVPINIYVAFSTHPSGEIINKTNVTIQNKVIAYSQSVELSPKNMETKISFDNPYRNKKGNITYVFEFFTKNSPEPFYEDTLITIR